jgi:hypothetical protein
VYLWRSDGVCIRLAGARAAGFVSMVFNYGFLFMVTGALLCLFYQLTVHQDWESDEKRGKKQTFMLCVVPNLIGLGLLYGFMRLKMHGAI